MPSMDPTGTTTLRNHFRAALAARFDRLAATVVSLVGADDAFGLAPSSRQIIVQNVANQFVFLSNSKKINAFREWLSQQVADGVLETDSAGRPWTSEFVYSAYKKGIVDAYIQSHKKDILRSVDAYLVGANKGREQFLRETFAAPATVRGLELMYIRDFTQLKGITAAVDAKLSDVLAGALANGTGPVKTAREMRKQIDSIGRYRSELLAHTETIRYFASGALDSFERLGIGELELDIELANTGVNVCPICQKLAGTVYTIETARGVIPLHPICKCRWKLARRKKVPA